LSPPLLFFLFVNSVAACCCFFLYTGSAAAYAAYAKLTPILFVNARGYHRGGSGGFRPDTVCCLVSGSGRTPKRERGDKVEKEAGGKRAAV
jgi:hypothetical protein